MKLFNPNAISSDELMRWKVSRWKARHNLQFLCNDILDYKHVCQEIHGPMISKLQKFPKVLPYINNESGAVIKNNIFWQLDDLSRGYINYKPLVPISELPGPRRTLILAFRGNLKTSINCTAHVLQWIINYPNVAILVCQSTLDKAASILKVIKQTFQYNQKFRELFPEHVPQKRIEDWGTLEKFTTEARDKTYARREDTCHAAGMDKGMAGMHFDLMKLSDVVETTNTKTLDSCLKTISDYNLIESCLVDVTNYWIDVEGTRYHNSDLYGHIIESDKKYQKQYGKSMWNIYCQSWCKKDTKGKPHTFSADELELPDLIDPAKKDLDIPVELKKVPWWPERAGLDVMAFKKMNQPFEYASQYSLRPLSAEEGMEPFPINEKLPIWITRDKFSKEVMVSYYDISVDTAETTTQRSDFSAIVVGAWSFEGYLYIVDLFHGKVLGDALIDQLFDMYMKWSSLGEVRSIKMENVGFNRGLQTGLSREMTKRGIHLPIQLVKRGNVMAKTDRIIKTLQPFYITGELRFLDDLPAKDYMIEEMKKIPGGNHDDILDAMSDLYQNKEYFGKDYSITPASEYTAMYKRWYKSLFDQWLGIEPITGYEPDSNIENSFYSKTGGL